MLRQSAIAPLSQCVTSCGNKKKLPVPQSDRTVHAESREASKAEIRDSSIRVSWRMKLIEPAPPWAFAAEGPPIC